jgi:DNA-binding IclR family transcriptional regulator
MTQVEARSTHEVGALKRGLLILDHLSASPLAAVSASEIARKMGIHRATALRLMNTLREAGYLEFGGRPGHYRLGPKGRPRQGSKPSLAALHVASIPILKRLAEETGETADLGVLYQGEVVLVQVAEGPQSVTVRQRVGDRRPAHLTSVGKMLLADLSEAELDDWIGERQLETRTSNSIASPERLRAELALIRQRGYSIDEQEYEIGLICIAAPVQDSSGATVAAVAVSGPSSRLTYHRIHDVIEKIRCAAVLLSSTTIDTRNSPR